MDTTEAAAATEAQETACISGVEQDLCFLFDFVSIVYIWLGEDDTSCLCAYAAISWSKIDNAKATSKNTLHVLEYHQVSSSIPIVYL